MPRARPSTDAAAPRTESGPVRAMHRLGLATDLDLALHLPLRYEDETQVVPIAAGHEGEVVQFEGQVTDARVERRARPQLIVRLRDPSGEVLLRFLHFYPSHRKAFAEGARVRVRGELRGGLFGREMVHPAFRVVGPDTPLPSTLTPVYPASAQLPQAYLRKAIESALARVRLDEVLPAELLPRGAPSLRDALALLHHPPAGARLETISDPGHPAWQRLKFEELLAQQLAQRLARDERATRRAPALIAAADDATLLGRRLLAALPFSLTGAQRRAADEIVRDLASGRPMHRLLQGDVGCGKTVVAALAATAALDAGWQCALMAPTELLAEQHLRKLVDWLEPLGVRVAWLAGSRRGKARERQLAEVASGEAALVVGTQAVIQEGVAFARLGLAIVDEQHRFGVAQRLALRRKLEGGGGLEPHLLMMTATPIPRTLAMAYYADLDTSTIDELPPGRTPILTKVVSDGRRAEVIDRIRDEAGRGRQVYWVCPVIEETEEGAGASPAAALRSAVETHAELQQALPGVSVGLLHGRMKVAEKAAVMQAFSCGAMQVLVATTVIEVGVDVPNASVMVVEHAERFGLAQLHQLRGRVGRGAAASVCVLIYAPPLAEASKARLKAMAATNDGFEIARRDLEIRGPGEFMGTRQSGDALLRFADLAQDAPLLVRAREAAATLLAQHPEAALAHLRRWLRGGIEFAKA